MIPVRMRNENIVTRHIVRLNARNGIPCQKGVNEHLMRPIIQQKCRMSVVTEFYQCDHSPQ